MHESVLAYQRHLEELGRSPRTVKQYVWHVKCLLDFLEKEPGQVQPLDLSVYRQHLAAEHNYSKNSLYLATKAIQNFFTFMKLETASKLAPPARRGALPKYLTEDDAHRLLDAARADERDHAILTLLLYTGLRVSEAAQLNCDDFDLSERTLHVVSGKGDKDRLVVFEANVEGALKRWFEQRQTVEHDALFLNRKGGRLSPRSIERIAQKYARAAGITKTVTPHVLRHTLATTLLRRGADIRIIQQLLGHASVATTQIYTHVDEAMLKGAYDKAAPNY